VLGGNASIFVNFSGNYKYVCNNAYGCHKSQS